MRSAYLESPFSLPKGRFGGTPQVARQILEYPMLQFLNICVDFHMYYRYFTTHTDICIYGCILTPCILFDIFSSLVHPGQTSLPWASRPTPPTRGLGHSDALGHALRPLWRTPNLWGRRTKPRKDAGWSAKGCAERGDLVGFLDF